MNTRVRTTAVVHSHMNKWHPNNHHIPAGTELDAFVDDNHIAWAPYQGETYPLYPHEYETA